MNEALHIVLLGNKIKIVTSVLRFQNKEITRAGKISLNRNSTFFDIEDALTRPKVYQPRRKKNIEISVEEESILKEEGTNKNKNGPIKRLWKRIVQFFKN